MRYFAILLSCMFLAGPANAQDDSQFPWSSNLAAEKTQPVGAIVKPVSVDPATIPTAPSMEPRQIFPTLRQDAQDTQPSPSDKPVPQDFNFNQVPAPGTSPYYDGAQQPGLSVQSRSVDEPCGDCPTGKCFCSPKRLFAKPLFGCNGPDLYGFAQFGYHDGNSILFNDRPDAVNLQQLWLTLDRPVWRQSNIGLRVDAVYGLDAQKIQAVGNTPVGAPRGWDNLMDNGSFGWAIPQAHLSWCKDNMYVRAGKFLSPFGYEQLPSIENFFYSRTYTRRFTEPASHTGAIVEIKRDNNTSLIAGATFGWDTGFEQAAGGFNLITGMRTQLNEDVNISLTSSIGDTGIRGSGTLNSLVAEMRLLPRLNYILQGDTLDLGTNQEFGIIQNLLFNVDNQRAFGARLEWWKSDQLTATTRSTWDFTLGSNYRLNSNILIRNEVRWDWGANAAAPGDAIVGVDAIIAF